MKPTKPKRYVCVYLGTPEYAAGLLELIHQARTLESESLSEFITAAALNRAQQILSKTK